MPPHHANKVAPQPRDEALAWQWFPPCFNEKKTMHIDTTLSKWKLKHIGSTVVIGHDPSGLFTNQLNLYTFFTQIV